MADRTQIQLEEPPAIAAIKAARLLVKGWDDPELDWGHIESLMNNLKEALARV